MKCGKPSSAASTIPSFYTETRGTIDQALSCKVTSKFTRKLLEAVAAVDRRSRRDPSSTDARDIWPLPIQSQKIMSRALSPTTSASSFFSADSELTIMAERDAFGQSGVFHHDPSHSQEGPPPESRLLEEQEEHDSGSGINFTQGSDECEATQPVWSQTQEATQPSSSGSSVSKSKQKKPPLSEVCWALLVPAAPNIGLSVWECRRDHPLAYRIGRNANRSEFHLPSRKISSLHAKLWMQPSHGSPLAPGEKVQDEGSVMLEDCSSNGVYVEGIKVGKGNKTALVSGNEVSFGPPSTEIHEDYRTFLLLQYVREGNVQLISLSQATSSARLQRIKQRWITTQREGFMLSMTSETRLAKGPLQPSSGPSKGPRGNGRRSR